MNENTIKQLYHIAEDFRQAILSLSDADFGQEINYLKHFPFGCCGITTLMHGAYLHAFGFDQQEYVCGMRFDFSHAWLELDEHIIDITSDQFSDGEAIYVGELNNFYQSFEIRNRHLWYESLVGKCIEKDWLYPTYKLILNKLV